MSQNIGIGLSNPSARLHLHQQDVFFDPVSRISLTNSAGGNTATDGLALWTALTESWLMNYEAGHLHLGTQGINRLSIRPDGRIGINTSNLLGSSDLTITSLNATGYGGMYVETPGETGGKPFYGYGVNGSARMWHYYDDATNTWRVNLAGDRLTLNSTGLGVNTITPQFLLDVNGRMRIGTDGSVPQPGVVQWSGEDFEGYTGSEWKSFTKVPREQILGYDDQVETLGCISPDTVLITDVSTSSRCVHLFDSGGPFGNYGLNEDIDFRLNVDFEQANVLIAVIEYLDIEDGMDTLFVHTHDSVFTFSSSTTEPDTVTFFPLISTGEFVDVRFKANGSNPGGPYEGFAIKFEWLDVTSGSVENMTGFFFDATKMSIGGGLGLREYWNEEVGNYAVSFGFQTRAGNQSVAIGKHSKAISKLGTTAATSVGAYTRSEQWATAVGYAAKAFSSGVAMGSFGYADAGVAIGGSSYSYGSSATALGGLSAAYTTKSTAIGYWAEASGEGAVAIGASSKAFCEDCTALGTSTFNTTDNSILIGKSTIGSIGGYQPWSNLSDGRYKFNINEDVPGLDLINALRPVTYQFDVEGFIERRDSARNINPVFINRARDQVRTGFIAQEVEGAASALGYDFSGLVRPQDDDDHYSLRYAEFVVPLTKAVQELSAEVEALRAEIQQLKSERDPD